MDASQVSRHFGDHFGGRPMAVVRSPGRVNLIGEHTDYNQGFVLPMAIDQAVWVAARPRSDRRLRVLSLDVEPPVEFALHRPEAARGTWAAYVAGVAWSLAQAGHRLTGWEGVVATDLPPDAGLSSSAALELAVARVFAALNDLPWDPIAMAHVARRAENAWVGVACGVMDQLACACGLSDHALLIDCRSLAIEPVPLPAGVVVLVLDTRVPRRLADTPYHRRQQECAAAARHLGGATLRDLDPGCLEARRDVLEENLYKRARHIITENERAIRAAHALRAGEVDAFGRLMLASQRSLVEDFEVSCPALDTMVQCALSQPGCHGARLTGAGFGGCAVALVETGSAQRSLTGALTAYANETGRSGRGWICRADDGTRVIECRSGTTRC